MTAEANSIEALVQAVNELSHTTGVLTERVTIADKTARRTRNLTWAVLLLVIVVTIFGGYQWHRVTSAATQQCENANEVRTANQALWGFVLSASAAEAKTEAERDDIEEFRLWTADLYRPRDCTDLSKVYETPDPPTLDGK